MEEIFTGAGALAVSFTPVSDRPVVESAFGVSDGPEEWVRITGLFDSASDPEGVRRSLEASVGEKDLPEWRVDRLEDREWVRAWMDHFRPMRFGRRLWVCPTGFEPPEDPEAVVVLLDPGLAFGTGTHPTTALCLEWLDAADLRGKRVVDYGCGSGILAVAAAKLGGAEILAFDVDPAAVEAAGENIARNGAADRVKVGLPDSVGGAVDILLANILSGTLIELAPRLAEMVFTGGIVVLSGILIEQAEEVIRAYAPWFDFQPLIIRESWVLLEGRRRDDFPPPLTNIS